VRKVLSRNARRIRPILQLLTKLDLHGDGVGGNGLSWLDGVYRYGIDTFFVDTAPVWARRWKTLIEDSDTPTVACPCVWREEASVVRAVSIPRYNRENSGYIEKYQSILSLFD